jgi:hypothetical protein
MECNILMNISSVQPNQGKQDEALFADKSKAALNNRTTPCLDTPGASTSSTGGRTPQVQAQRITAYIDSIQEQLDLILVHYPPFFPIGTYQRLDLIEKIRGIQEEVEMSSIDESVKQTFGSETLKDDATDEDINVALDKLFGLRDNLMKDRSVSPHKAHPGSILNIKV